MTDQYSSFKSIQSQEKQGNTENCHRWEEAKDMKIK